MKIIKIITLLAVIFSITACESEIRHDYYIKNNLNENITMEAALKSNPDSVFNIRIFSDSTEMIFSDNEIQGFFTGKVMPVNPSEMFDVLSIKLNDSASIDSLLIIDSLWKTDYNPGEYIYTFIID